MASIAEKPRGGVDSALAALKTKAGHLDWDKVEADWETTESARLEACRRIRAGEKGFSLLVAKFVPLHKIEIAGVVHAVKDIYKFVPINSKDCELVHLDRKNFRWRTESSKYAERVLRRVVQESVIAAMAGRYAKACTRW